MTEIACLDCGRKFRPYTSLQVRCGQSDTKGTCAYKHRRHKQKLFERAKRNNMKPISIKEDLRFCLGRCKKKTPHTKHRVAEYSYQVNCLHCNHQGNAVA